MGRRDVHVITTKRYFPERRVVAVSSEVEDGPGYAVEPLKFFSEHGIRMLSSVVQSHPDRKLLHATFFLDLMDSDLPLGEVVRRLSRIPHIRRLEVIDLPLTHGEARLAVLMLDDVHHLFDMLRGLGTGGLAILYHMGLRAGRALAGKVSPYFKDNRRSLEYMLMYYESLGHGRFRLKDYVDGAYCRVDVGELLECIDVRGEGPNSQLFGGMLAGFLSELWGRGVEVAEVRCIALDDKVCEFEVRAK